MKKSVECLAVLVLCALATGCAAPGSAICRTRVTGHLFDQAGLPLKNQQLDLLLPSQYGLAGLDARWGKPEDYGHRDQKATLATDDKGRFDHAFMPTTYSIAFWIFPPLGTIPRKPPEPYFYLKLPSQTNEFWVLWMKKEGLETKVIERGNRTPRDQSQLLPAAFSGKLIWEPHAEPRGYLVDVEMRLQTEAAKDGANNASQSAYKMTRADAGHFAAERGRSQRKHERDSET